jgi:transposase
MDTRSRDASIGMRDVVVSGDIVKVLWFDGDGLCLLAKRLERGRFVWPQASSGTVSLSRAQLSMLLEGIDWERRITEKEIEGASPLR